MSEYTTPISTAFELQRSSIKQSHRALENSVDMQKQFNAAVLDSFDSTEEAQKKGVELTRTALHSYLDAVEASMPGVGGSVEEFRASIDEGFDAFAENHAEAFDTVEAEVEKGTEAYDEMLADYLEAVNEQIETLLETHEEFEGQTLDSFEQAETQFEEMQTQLEQQSEEFTAQFEDQTARVSEQLEQQFDQFQSQLEEMQARVEDVQESAGESLQA